MRTICVSSYDEIKRIANSLSEDAKNEIFYRGTSNSLVPSIVQSCQFNTYADLVAKEYLLLNEFKKYSNIKYTSTEIIAQDWEIRAAAREHGLASSLMDWSNCLDLAIEFAIHNFEAKKIIYTNLWILNKSKLPKIEIGNGNVDKKFDEIFEPTIVNIINYSRETYFRRKFIQGGYFLKQPYEDICTSLETNPVFSEKLVHIIIPKDCIPELWKKRAKEINLDLSSMAVFDNSAGTLDNICKELNNKYA